MQQKSENLLQAQVASFAHEGVPNSQDASHFYRKLSNLALSDNAEAFSTFQADQNADPQVYDGYTDYLRRVGGQNHEGIRERAEMLDAYASFDPAITDLKRELSTTENNSEHEKFLGSGSSTSAFAVEVDDKKYAVRGPGAARSSSLFIDQRLATGILTKGVPHTEQIVAASYKTGNVVAELAPGKEIGKLSIREIQEISDEQLSDLAGAAIELSRRDVAIDEKPSNFFYDPQEGFTLIDLNSKLGSVTPEVVKTLTLGQTVGSVVWAMQKAGNYGISDLTKVRTEAEYALEYDTMQAADMLASRYKAVVADKLSGQELAEALEEADKYPSQLDMSKEEYVAFWMKFDQDSPPVQLVGS